MSIVDAYRCDRCEQIRPASEIIGVHSIEDMFNPLSSYPIEKKDPGKCKAHFCITCYNDFVFKAADRFYNKGRAREKWQAKADELSFALRKSVITKVFSGITPVNVNPRKKDA